MRIACLLMLTLHCHWSIGRSRNHRGRPFRGLTRKMRSAGIRVHAHCPGHTPRIRGCLPLKLPSESVLLRDKGKLDPRKGRTLA